MTGSGNKRKPNGDMDISCLPRDAEPWRPPADAAQALVQVRKRPGRDGTMVTISALARANLLAAQVTYVNQMRAYNDSEKAAKKNKGKFSPAPNIPMAAPGMPGGPPGPPTVPPGVSPLVITVPQLPRYSRVKVVVTIRGHRILLIETGGWFNKRVAWEARLLYPNYPLDDTRGSESRTALSVAPRVVTPTDTSTTSGAPVEGVHYTLLMRHDEIQPCCACCCNGSCCKCYGGAALNSRLVIKPGVMHALETTVAPPSNAGLAPADKPEKASATGPEIVLVLVSIAPAVNMVIVQRKAWVVVMPLMALAAVGVLLRIILAITKY
ncbi:hypothetical protein AMAG_11213 [Allomyces macrogynus ATCC 38327]|uniref:Uncharacterized protein n=1 Tax=Allomyces macrogynus (strain ATCC 38327) TaxID=578462 RepID=A0A0L0SWJ5_ALLM3|nr:hypothetical protein AMAG_11213 [Allomyces macrogynus ATCC 38327]|eukprot:KNE66714.1 hypothetical protein AMAG_11213 [Allomyces macrogynus ATCC 38327]